MMNEKALFKAFWSFSEWDPASPKGLCRDKQGQETEKEEQASFLL
ncbi:MAG: hypothetical protein WCD79_23440 [Chthoniobacteraceae bacterium]